MDTKLGAIYDLGQKLILLLDAHQIADATLDIAALVFDFQDSEFLLVDEMKNQLYVAARRGQFSDVKDLRLPLDGEEGITVVAARACQIINVPDVRQDPRYVFAGFDAVSEMAIPVHIDGRVLGVLNLESDQRGTFDHADQEVLSILASQAALALEAARLHAAEHRKMEEVLALNKVSGRINATLDLQETLDTILGAVAELVSCSLAEISLWDEQKGMLVLQALRSTPERTYPIGHAFPPGEGYTGWVVRNRSPLLVPDVDAYQELCPEILPGELPFKAYVGLPLHAGDEFFGTLVLVHDQAGAFDENDLQLLDNLGERASTAIRNARLYEGVYRRHQELSALLSVLEAINRPLDLEALLKHALDRVIDVTQASGGGIRLFDTRSQDIVLVAHQGLSETYIREAGRLPLSQEDIGYVARTRQPLLSGSTTEDPRLSRELGKLLDEMGYHSFAQVPLCAQDQVVGTLGVMAKPRDYFSLDDLKLLNAIGQQLGIAIDNAQLFEETQRKANRLAALNSVASVINRQLPIEEIIEQAIARVAEVMETDISVIRLLDPQTEELIITSSRGLSPEYLRQEHRIRLGDDDPVTRVVMSGEPLVIADLKHDPKAAALPVTTREFQAFAFVPLMAKDSILGTLGVANRESHEFSPEEIDLLTSIGHQLAVTIENAHLRQDALEAERLTAVGRVATSVAHDLRSPLGGIMRSAEFLARPELSQNTRHKLSRAIVSMSRRLANTAQQILDYVQKDQLPLNRSPCKLSQFLDDVLAVLEVDFSDRGIEVIRDCCYQGEVVIDADRMAQVVYNIATNARDAMPKGGSFMVSSQKVEQFIELRMSDTGPGVPEEYADHIFEPFFTYGKREGAGLGLSISRRIVEEHGGTIRLESGEEHGATFVISLPLN
ncbi:MAG: GAF domain-containing protein [Anaerolineales bacterium]